MGQYRAALRRSLNSTGRIEPYRPMMNLKSFLGTHHPRPGHTGQTFGTGAPIFCGAQPAPGSPQPLSDREKLQEDAWNASAAERARHAFQPRMREYEHEASVAHRGAVIAVSFMLTMPAQPCETQAI